jgi:hypothetical protein
MDDQLKQLFDYTKFHIGLYTTLITAIIAVFANDTLKRTYESYLPYIKVVIICFLVAGAAGGLVASSIPFFKDFATFSQARLGPWGSELVPSILCTHVEHTAFWIGIAVAVFGLLKVLRTADP